MENQSQPKKVVSVSFFDYHHIAKCRTTDCESHYKLFRFEFNSIDYFYICEKHLPLFYSESLNQVVKIIPELGKPFLNSDSLITIIELCQKELSKFKTYSADDLIQKINEKIKN